MKKNDVSYYGYKNHIGVDAAHKLIRNFAVTDAAVHDSRMIEELLDPDNTNGDVYADSAYRSTARQRWLEDHGYRDRICRKGSRNRPLSQRQQAANRRKSRTRVRVEHVFGTQLQLAGNLIVRTIGMARARVKIGLRNLTYNLHRYTVLLNQKMSERFCGKRAAAAG